MRSLPMKGGDEYDALTRWRKVLDWRAGERSWIKRKYRRRERHTARRFLQKCAE